MKTLIAVFLSCALAGNILARDSSNRITLEIQNQLNAGKRTIAQWAANPTIVAAVKAQNAKGPIPKMTNSKWRALDANDPIVRSLQKNVAGVWLTQKATASNGMLREAFLSGAVGEKAAFIEKPTSYLHVGDPKFDVPMKGSQWQGKPDWDKSSSSYVVQLSTPVLDHGRPIGVLVTGFSMKSLKTQR